MSKVKRRHNWKGRQNISTVIDNSESDKIKIEIPGLQGHYDANNLLVLPSQKRKTKKLNENKKIEKVLTKKQKKKLQKLVERKQRKGKSEEIIKALAENQPSKEEQDLFVSFAQMQTKGLKRHFSEAKINKIEDVKVSSISGSGSGQVTKKRKIGDNDVPFSSSEYEDTSEEELEIEKVPEESSVSKTDNTLQNEDQIDNKSDVIEKPVIKLEPKKKVILQESKNKKPALYVPVNRTPEIQEARLKLPILAEEQVIMETISENAVTILCGETGSGKTTQVPQFLYEAGYTSNGQIIGITEPRRVAAISMSRRVAKEMALNREVSYQIRYEGNVTNKTLIKFMTDGVLLKEVEKDFLLTRYSAIIIDEAHERSVFTDILIGLLSRIVPLRNKKGNPLKLIIMSATLRVEDFTQNSRLFKISPPVIKVDTRQHNVDIHFNKRTPLNDYLAEAYKKVCKIHQSLPEGGILVFVTGQQEVRILCRKLRRIFPLKQPFNAKRVEEKVGENKSYEEDDSQYDDVKIFKKGMSRKASKKTKNKNQKKPTLPQIDLNSYSITPLDEAAFSKDEDLSDLDEENFEEDNAEMSKLFEVGEPLFVLPLYSLLPSHKQIRVFQPPPEGSRLCIIATNIAETSLTIPNIKYVVDTGKVKTKFYDKVTGVSTFKVTWISKASAAQRAGRSGRTTAGHCYRLFSSAVFNNEFVKFSEPEITQRPVDDLVLQLKAIGISDVVNFPFPTAPHETTLKVAEQRLISLGALEPALPQIRVKGVEKECWTSKVTPLGRTMSCFPVAPRYAKMLALGNQHNLMPFIICLVAALSVQELFMEGFKTITPNGSETGPVKPQTIKFSALRRLWAGQGHFLMLGDLMTLLKSIGACEYEGCSPEFCEDNGLRYKAVLEIRKLRVQLTNAVNMIVATANLSVDPQLAPPTDQEAKLIQQIVLSASGDYLAKKIPESNLWNSEEKAKWKFAYQCPEMVDPVYIHPQSVLSKLKPDYVIYQELFETSKIFMRTVMASEPEWIPIYVKNKCTFSKPQENPAPHYDERTKSIKCHMSSTFGLSCWQLPAVELDFPPGLEKYKWFARFFLEGKVCPLLEKFKSDLLASPNIMIKTWARLHQQTEIILKALMGKEVDSKEMLLRVWENDKKYLLHAYSQWLPEAHHSQLATMWPPV